MENKNLLIFFLVAALILVGHALLQNHFWPAKPPAPRGPSEQAAAAIPDASRCALLAAAAGPATPGVSAGGGLGPLVAALGAVRPPDRPVKRDEPPPPPKAVARKLAPSVPHVENIALGDERFNLKVRLTSRGAGVQGLVLRQFQAADEQGRPVWRPDKTIEPQDLIPDNPFHPSNVLYHYDETEGTPETLRPEETLGLTDWALVSRRNGPEDPEHEVVFAAEMPGKGVLITKTYRLRPGDYHIGLTVRFDRKKNETVPATVRYQLDGPRGMPIEGRWYTYTYRNALVGRVDARGTVWRDLQDAGSVGMKTGGSDVRREDKIIQYAGVATQYFASVIAVDHAPEVPPEKWLAWARPTLERNDEPDKPFLDDITVRVVSEAFEVRPGEPVVHQYALYNGPVKVMLLGQLEGRKAVEPAVVDKYVDTLHLNTLTDYGRFGWWSDLIIACTNFMHRVLAFLHNHVIPWSYGLCIVLLTIMVRGMMFPLSRRQALASARMQAKMAELAPEVKKLEEKHKGDSMALQMAKTELYRKRGVNPMAMAGSCWVMFLQLPIFLGLYYALQESIHFRLAPLFPGIDWIQNLAAPDMLIRWGEHIPFVSRPQDLTRAFPGSLIYLGPYFNILPVLAVALMIVQQKLTTPPPTDEQQAASQKMMKYMTGLVGLMFYKVAAGLALYFIASSVWGLTERKLLPKRQITPGAEPAKPGGAVARAKARVPERDGNGKLQKVRDFWERVLKEAKKK